MENGVVDSGIFIDPEEGLKVIEQFYKDNFSDYTIEKEYNFGGFHGFGMILKKENVQFRIGGARGRIDYTLIMDNQVVDLLRYDERLKYVKTVNVEIINFVFSVIKRYLNEREMENK